MPVLQLSHNRVTTLHKVITTSWQPCNMYRARLLQCTHNCVTIVPSHSRVTVGHSDSTTLYDTWTVLTLGRIWHLERTTHRTCTLQSGQLDSYNMHLYSTPLHSRYIYHIQYIARCRQYIARCTFWMLTAASCGSILGGPLNWATFSLSSCSLR